MIWFLDFEGNLTSSNGLQPTSDALQPSSDGLQPTSDALHPSSDGLQSSSFLPWYHLQVNPVSYTHLTLPTKLEV